MLFRFLVALVMALTACSQPQVTAPVMQGQIPVQTKAPAPQDKGLCWGQDVTPAIIETVTEQILLSEEQRDVAGMMIRPASYRSNTQHRMLQDTRRVWFRTPCAETLTVRFIATLQRALKARGFYTAAVTGERSIETAEAIRRFQAQRGLDSTVLSLSAAQELGLLATNLGDP
jgi:hypothetical protein